jgi:ferredoxin
MNSLTVDDALCTRCGTCVEDCPIAILVQEGAATPKYVAGQAERCAYCAHCASVCPTGALEIKASKPRPPGEENTECSLRPPQVEG